MLQPRSQWRNLKVAATAPRRSARLTKKGLSFFAFFCGDQLLAAVFVASLLQAADLSAGFEQANKLYEKGNYPEAIQAYSQLLDHGYVSGPLYFNLGNAHFKSGQTGRALLSYMQAERLAPRDPDIKANLRFARDTLTGGAAAPVTRWREVFSVLTLDEMTWLVAAIYWLWFALLVAKEVKSELGASLRSYLRLTGAACCLSLSVLGFRAYQGYHENLAVVVAPEAVVRYGPLEESQSFYTLRDGAEVLILDQKAAWFQVKDAAGRIGWLRGAQVATFNPVP